MSENQGNALRQDFALFQGGSGTEPELETRTVGTVFVKTSILYFCTDIMVAYDHHGSRLHPGEKRAATSETRVSLSDYHHSHRPATMTTTSNDNHHVDQDDIMREDDVPPPSESSWN